MKPFPLRTLFLLVMISFLLTGCGAAVVGTATVSAYKSMSDNRTIGQIVDDSLLSAKVSNQISTHEVLSGSGVDVDVINGVVYLVGVVPSQAYRQMAGDVAKQVEGVRHVENQLMVGQISTKQVFNDLYLASKLRTLLIREPDISSINIDIDVNNKVITLTGTVAKLKEKKKILDISQNVAKDVSVVDNLMVTSN